MLDRRCLDERGGQNPDQLGHVGSHDPMSRDTLVAPPDADHDRVGFGVRRNPQCPAPVASVEVNATAARQGRHAHPRSVRALVQRVQTATCLAPRCRLNDDHGVLEVEIKTAVAADADDVLDAFARRLTALPDVRVEAPTRDVLVVRETWTPRWAFLLFPVARLFLNMQQTAVVTIAVDDDGRAANVTITGECRDASLLEELESVASELER